MNIDFRDRMRAAGLHATRPSLYNPIKAGNFNVSIQASSFHYCMPRASGLPLEQYEAFEVGIGDADMNWILPRKSLVQFAWVSRFESGPFTSVAGWLTVAEVQQLVDDLCTMDSYENGPVSNPSS